MVNLVTGRVFRYNPINHTLTTVSAPWPPGVNTLPGGFTVFSNKLYILGGFNNPPTGDSTDQIWEFTPSPAGWVQKSTLLPVPRSYIPTTTIGSLIYTGGGSDIVAGSLTDTTDSFVFDPVADNISTIASIPRATSNTRGLNFCNQLYVLGGQFPTPSNEVDIYDPLSDTWSVGMPMLTARRNAAMDTDGTDHFWAAGGYDPGRIVLTANEKRGQDRVQVRLSWTGATSPTINIYRDGVRIATVQNTGRYADVLTTHGFFTYQVCEAGTRNCSNEVRVRGL